MTSLTQAEVLAEIAAARSDPRVPLCIVRDSSCGTPVLWNESTEYVRGSVQRYDTIRSATDEGGDAIGSWWSPNDSSLELELLDQLQTYRPWERPEELSRPGQEVISWSFTIGRFAASLSYPGDSEAGRQLSKLGMLMRRIPYWLIENTQGNSQSATLDCVAAVNSSGTVSVSLENRGTHTVVCANPFLAPQAWGDSVYVAVELAAPLSKPDRTGLGLIFQPLEINLLSLEPEPWNQTHLVIAPGTSLQLPCEAHLPANMNMTGHSLRAVFSDYDTVPAATLEELVQSVGAIQVLGRVFSVARSL